MKDHLRNKCHRKWSLSNSGILRILLLFIFAITSPQATQFGGQDNGSSFERMKEERAVKSAEEIAQQAIDAVREGNIKAAQQHLQRIDSLTSDQKTKTSIDASSMVQGARNMLDQAETKRKQLSTQNQTAKQAEIERVELERIVREEEATQTRLQEIEDQNRKEAEARRIKAQNTHPIDQTKQKKTFQDGQSLADSRGTDLTQALQKNPSNTPGYAGSNVALSQMNPHDLKDAALQALNGNEAAKIVTSSLDTKGKFFIDPHSDPLILAANKALEDPQKSLSEQMEVNEGGVDATENEITCEEGGDEFIQRCSKLLEIKLQITPETSSTTYVCGGHKERRGLHMKHWTCGGCVPRTTTIPKKVVVVSEEWVDSCGILEDHAEKGFCRYIGKTESEKNETRYIQGEPVPRDHFEEHYEYSCFKAPQKACKGLREKGCYQIRSVCKEQQGSQCVVWLQTYRCSTGKARTTSYRSSNKENPYCLSGDCTDTSYEANKDFAEVMSQMSVLKEAQKDLRNFSTIFKGQDRRCTRNCLDFRDCCGSQKGWGVSLHLANCDANEKELRVLRDKNLCIQVGTYCAEKDPILKTCIRKKTTFCCYTNKLARILQQYGRPQLNLGFGTPEHPQCQGFTAEQLSKIDFSKIDFSEFHGDIVARTNTPNPEAITKSIQKSMQNKAILLTPPIQKNDSQNPTSTVSNESPVTSVSDTTPTTLVQGCSRDDF